MFVHVRDFIAKWQANARSERAACQEHFIDLCGVLGEPPSNTDPTGATYAFEKDVTKASGGDGWADVWRRGCFAWKSVLVDREAGEAIRHLPTKASRPAVAEQPRLVRGDEVGRHG